MQPEPPIEFHSEDIDFELADQDRLLAWIERAVVQEGGAIEHINFIFCSDEHLHGINLQYLQHDDYTDVITFPYHEEEDQPIEGDIFISIERIRDNARQFEVSEAEELHRVMIHGVLHLLGYTDEDEQEQALMRGKEDAYLALLRA